ncbi:MAG: nucleotidyltransferase family protein [Minwuia sp.]|nr:nucleotidyltransferase family protein [Minwuia sp.]
MTEPGYSLVDPMSGAVAREDMTLALICRPDQMQGSDIGALTGDDWSQILAWAAEHRFMPYLHYSIGRAGLRDTLPAEVQRTLAAAYRRSTLRALSMQRDMIHVSRVLDDAGIGHLFLKGAYLAHFAYPESGLRPMRDLDVLVRRDQAMAAFNALLANGLERNPKHMGNPEVYLAGSKHLPTIRVPGGASVEVHTLTTTPSALMPYDPALGRHEVLGQRAVRRTVAGQDISFSGPEDLLLHICVHAVLDNQFNNGPLTLTDIAWILDHHQIDWPTFWDLARQQQATRGVALALRLLEREWPGQQIAWDDAAAAIIRADDPILPVAAHSLLRSVEARGDVALQAELADTPTVGGKIGRLLGRAFPSRARIAREFPVDARSPRVFLYYPLKWWRLRLRLSGFLRNSTDDRAQRDLDNFGTIVNWLKG